MLVLASPCHGERTSRSIPRRPACLHQPAGVPVKQNEEFSAQRLIQALQILGLSIAAAVFYGLCHDQITAHVCVEYFTIGHPRVIASQSPILLGLVWGVRATWWVGMFLGIPLAIVATAGPLPRVTARDLLRPIGMLLAIMAGDALVVGLVGYASARVEWIWLLPPLSTRVPASRHAHFLADLWSHSASYGIGFLGGNVLLGWTWYRRRQKQRAADTSL